MILGTAGHVDHGKTALVRALTGVETDRLEEERRRGLSIELGFAPLLLPGGLQASLVDVPGHEHFIPTMLSGAAGMDLVLLVVAADEGPMPQTREHLNILSLLGVRDGVIALSRADLASPEQLARSAAALRALTAGTFLERAPTVAVSAVTGQGLDALRGALAELLNRTPPAEDAGRPRLHVDRRFSVDGSGTVVTGTLTGGALRQGDILQIYPSDRTARVRALQCHGQSTSRLEAGTRAAVNLSGMKPEQIRRGDTLAYPDTLTLTDRADVLLRLLPDAPFPVRTNSQLHVHLGARALVCRCVLLGRERLEPGQEGFAQLRFSQPVATLPGERYVVRFFSPLATIGGGVLLDLDPPRRGRNAADRLEGLSIRAYGTPEDRAARRLLESGTVPLESDEPALYASVGGIEAGGAFLSPAGWKALCHQAEALLHERPGLPISSLRAQLFPRSHRRTADAFLSRLAAQLDLASDGQALYLPGQLPSGGTLERELEAFYRQAGLTPPTNREAEDRFAADRPAYQAAVRSLVGRGALLSLSRTHRVYGPACRGALETLRAQFGGSPFTLAQVRDSLGITRKYALFLLEYWDKQRITRKNGDARTLL